MNEFGYLTLALLSAMVFFGSARWALLGLMGGVLYMTLGQGVDVLGMNIFPTRVLTLAAMLRVLVRGEWATLRFNAVDRLVVLAFGYQAAVYILNGNGSAKTMAGVVTDVTLGYFSCRCLLRSVGDLEWLLRALSGLLVLYVGLLFIESSTRSNPFTAIGGIADLNERSGRPRCIGSFGHAALLGTFGASFVPLYLAMAARPGARVAGLIGVALCMAIVVFSNSGGPLTCTLIAVTGSLMWRWRTQMSVVRCAMVALLLLLGVGMQAPLWYLPAKMSELTGGDGWHRSYLMEVAFRNMDQWWLLGMPASDTKGWFAYRLPGGGADITNYYVAFAISSGILAVGLFCALLIRVYSRLGRAMATLRERGNVDTTTERWLWALGVVLSVHVFNWFGLVYFDQYQVVFLLQLAAMSTLSAQFLPSVEIHPSRQRMPTPVVAPTSQRVSP